MWLARLLVRQWWRWEAVGVMRARLLLWQWQMLGVRSRHRQGQRAMRSRQERRVGRTQRKQQGWLWRMW